MCSYRLGEGPGTYLKLAISAKQKYCILTWLSCFFLSFVSVYNYSKLKCLVKNSNTYLFLPSICITLHYVYLCSNPAYFDTAWTKHPIKAVWGVAVGLPSVSVVLIIHLATGHSSLGRHEGFSPAIAQNTVFPPIRPHPAISRHGIVSHSFFPTVWLQTFCLFVVHK